MANVIHKTTLETIRSVHTPDYDPAVWEVNPTNFDEIEATPRRYRKGTASGIVAMTPGERGEVDQAEAEATEAGIAGEALGILQTDSGLHRALKGIAVVVLREFRALKQGKARATKTIGELIGEAGQAIQNKENE